MARVLSERLSNGHLCRPRTTKREKRPTERLARVPDEILDHFAAERPRLPRRHLGDDRIGDLAQIRRDVDVSGRVLRCAPREDSRRKRGARGCADILIAVIDGLKGMSEALAVAYPSTTLRTCLVHLIRNSLELAGWQDRKTLAVALRAIYTAASAEAASAALDAFDQDAWGVAFRRSSRCGARRGSTSSRSLRFRRTCGA
jgi:hypothetical protein